MAKDSSPNYEPSSNETHENDIQENQHGDPGIPMGSNTPQPTIVWNSSGKQKSFVFICNCYQTFEFLKCKAIGSPIPMQPFPVDAMFFWYVCVKSLVILGGFVLGKTWQFHPI